MSFAAHVKYFLSYRIVSKELSTFEERRKEKGKEKKSIYIAQFILHIVSKRSDMNHTVLPANYTMPAFSS